MHHHPPLPPTFSICLEMEKVLSTDKRSGYPQGPQDTRSLMTLSGCRHPHPENLPLML